MTRRSSLPYMVVFGLSGIFSALQSGMVKITTCGGHVMANNLVMPTTLTQTTPTMAQCFKGRMCSLMCSFSFSFVHHFDRFQGGC
jgi:hypothetical protein